MSGVHAASLALGTRSNKKDSRAWFVHCLRGAKPPSLLHTHSENNSSQLHTPGCACLLEPGFGTSTLKADVLADIVSDPKIERNTIK
jgi:hypothetical protein